MSSAKAREVQYKAWAAARETYKLANRGDVPYTAQRRLFRKQMHELRKQLMQEDLLKRRAAYVEKREQLLKAEARAKNSMVESVGLNSAQMQKKLLEEKELAKKTIYLQHKRRLGAKSNQRWQEYRDGVRREWLEKLVEEQDFVGEKASLLGSNKSRKSTWLTPENLSVQLSNLSFGQRSPVDHWVGVARLAVEEEERALLNSGLGEAMAAASHAPLSIPEDPAEIGAEDLLSAAPPLGVPSDAVVVQARKDHAAVDGSDGFTLVDYIKQSELLKGGKVSVTERVALLPGQEPPEPELQTGRLADRKKSFDDFKLPDDN